MTSIKESTRNAGIGARIRVRRRELNLTLQQLAALAGLSTGFISLVERGQTSPSLSSLTNIADALDFPIGTLVTAPEPPHPDSHGASRPKSDIGNGRVAYECLSTVFPGSQVQVVKILMPAGYESKTVSHAGEEFVFVLRGEIEYSIQKKLYRLRAGNSVHFDAASPHSVRTIGGDVQIIWVSTLDIHAEGKKEGGKSKAALFGSTEFQCVELET